MIQIHNFKEACSSYQQGQIPFRLLQDQAMVLLGMCPLPGRYIDEAFDISVSDIEWLLQQPDVMDNYDEMLGGDVYVCQSEDDLKEVVGVDMAFVESHDGRWPNVTDQVMSWDACHYLSQKSAQGEAPEDAPEDTAEWAMFLICWNNAGGPVFYVPKHLWMSARVAEHIAETNRAWGW